MNGQGVENWRHVVTANWPENHCKATMVVRRETTESSLCAPGYRKLQCKDLSNVNRLGAIYCDSGIAEDVTASSTP